MRRRKFITLIGGAAAWPLAARAQQPAMPVVGLISPISSSQSVSMEAAFQQALTDSGFVNGRNVEIEFH